ncbi:MAG: MFS transporter [Brevefilum sp.]|nr:MFS transporter [Brevefilum sp.]
MNNRPQKNRWRLVLVLGSATLLSLSGDLTLYAILPVNAGGLLLTLAQIGVLLSANRFVRLLSNPLTGFLLDRGKRRPIFLTGMLLGTLSTLVYAQTRMFWVLLIGRLMWGVAWSFINVGGNTMVIDSTQPADRGRFLGVLNLLLSLGLALNPLIGGFLADALGFRPTMLVCALLTGAGFLLALLLLPETHPVGVPTAHQEIIGSQPAVTNQHTRLPVLFRKFNIYALGWQTWLAILLTFVIFFAGNGLIMATIGRYLALELGEGHIFRGTLIGISALTGIVLSSRSLLIAGSAPLSGALSDRGNNRWPAVLVGLTCGALGMFALGILPTTPALFMGIVLVSLSEGVLFTVLPAIIGDQALSSHRGRALGLAFMASDLGAALAPLLVYSIISLIPLRSAYLASAAMFALGLGLVLGIVKRKK